MDISVVVPLLNEAESLPELESWIRRVMDEHGFSYEIVFVDDGSTDNSWAIIQGLAEANPNVKALRFRRNYGKSPALNEGFKVVEGDVVITMDADLQDSPDEIPELYKMIKEEGYDLVSGWKKVRYDSKLMKNIPSKFFNWTTRRMSGIKLHDFNCGLKAYRNEVVKNIQVYGEMHRYIPVIATMHFFGMLGSITFLVGFGIAVYLTCTRIFGHVYGMTRRPLFYFALLAIVIGVQLFSTGFLAEMITSTQREKRVYSISERINA